MALNVAHLPAASHSQPELGELRALVERHARPDSTTAIDGVMLSSVASVTEPRSAVWGTVFVLSAQGTKRIAIGDQIHDCGAGHYVVTSVDLPVTAHYIDASAHAPALGFGLRLKPATIAGLLLESGRVTLPSPRGGSELMAFGIAEADPVLLDAVVRTLQLLDRPSDQAVLAPMLEREIVWRLLTGPLGAAVRRIGLSDSSATQISGAVSWITEHFEQPFRVEDLALECGMSTSSFHRKFQAMTGYSPIQFQKQTRLLKARLLLMTGVEDATTIGYRVGYDSTSQFTREYKRLFGLPPWQDARLLRETT
jgi:AraC-like DNA-binding protein